MCVSNEKYSQRVLQAVATVENADPTDLPPLYEAIDPDALNALFQTDNGAQTAVDHVRFHYAGHTVVVQGDGRINVDGSTVYDSGESVH